MDRRWERLLSAYLDGELTPEEMRAVEARLRQDPEAQALYRELAGVQALLQRLPARRSPEDLEDRILREVQRRAERAGRRRWRAVLAGGLAAAAAAVVLLPLVRGELDRLRAAESGAHWFAWVHASRAAGDLVGDRTAWQVTLADTALILLGERPSLPEGER